MDYWLLWRGRQDWLTERKAWIRSALIVASGFPFTTTVYVSSCGRNRRLKGWQIKRYIHTLHTGDTIFFKGGYNSCHLRLCARAGPLDIPLISLFKTTFSRNFQLRANFSRLSQDGVFICKLQTKISGQAVISIANRAVESQMSTLSVDMREPNQDLLVSSGEDSGVAWSLATRSSRHKTC